jgi:hypothetical protein
MSKKVWVVTWESVDTSREDVLAPEVYLSEESLKNAMWPKIRSLAKDEREAYDLDPEDEDRLLKIESEKDFWEAYELWSDYSSDVEPDETFTIEETVAK